MLDEIIDRAGEFHRVDVDRLGDSGAPPDPGGHDSLVGELAIGTLDGLEADVERRGKFSARR